jgi:uncharacterized membrane protein
MSVPLIFIMVSNHFPGIYGHDMGWALLAGLIVLGWAVTWWIYQKSRTDAVAAY